MVEKNKLKVPEECKMVVPLAEVVSKQKTYLVTLKNKQTRERERYGVRINQDGKTATMVDYQHPAYKAYAEARAKVKKEKHIAKQAKIADRLKKRADKWTERLEAVNKRVEKFRNIVKDLKTQLRAAKNTKSLVKKEARKQRLQAELKKLEAN